MKKFSGHKLHKFPTGHSLRNECEYPYKPPMKGGHRHNYIYNVCYRITFRSKSARHRVSREDKRFFIANFYTALLHKLVTLGDILKRRK